MSNKVPIIKSTPPGTVLESPKYGAFGRVEKKDINGKICAVKTICQDSYPSIDKKRSVRTILSVLGNESKFWKNLSKKDIQFLDESGLSVPDIKHPFYEHSSELLPSPIAYKLLTWQLGIVTRNNKDQDQNHKLHKAIGLPEPLPSFSFVMPWVEQIPVSELSIDDIANVIMQVSQQLKALHELKLIHNDLKGDNVLISKTLRNKVQAKLSDLGLGTAITMSPFKKKSDTQRFNSLNRLPNKERVISNKTDIALLGFTIIQILIHKIKSINVDMAELIEDEYKSLRKNNCDFDDFQDYFNCAIGLLFENSKTEQSKYKQLVSLAKECSYPDTKKRIDLDNLIKELDSIFKNKKILC